MIDNNIRMRTFFADESEDSQQKMGEQEGETEYNAEEDQISSKSIINGSINNFENILKLFN